MFRVVGVRPDNEPVLILEQTTRHGAEMVLRLIRCASPFPELRIEGGPESEANEMAHALSLVTPDD
jgi:hypothetical protein